MFTVHVHTSDDKDNYYDGKYDDCMTLARTLKAFPEDVTLVDVVDEKGHMKYNGCLPWDSQSKNQPIFTVRAQTFNNGRISYYDGKYDDCMALLYALEAFPLDVMTVEVMDEDGNVKHEWKSSN